jgi:hypothetical protein
MTMPLVKLRPMKPAAEMMALQKINLRELKRSSRKPTAGLTIPDSNWRNDMAAEMTQRSQPKVRSNGDDENAKALEIGGGEDGVRRYTRGDEIPTEKNPPPLFN